MNEQTRELIRQRMEKLGINQVQLGDRLSMTSSQVSRIISGERGTTLDNLLAIADALRIDRSYFLKVASGTPPGPNDPWVEETSSKLNLVPHGLRGIVDSFVDSMVQGSDNHQKARARPKQKSAT